MRVYQVNIGVEATYFSSQENALRFAREQAEEMLKDETINMYCVDLPRLDRSILLACLNGDISTVADSFTYWKSIHGKLNAERA